MACWSTFPGSAKAHHASWVNNLFLMEDVSIYNDHVNPGKPVGTLSAYQSVKVVTTANGNDDPQWYLVETWLGSKWIKADNRMVSGYLQEADQEITTIFVAPLYDHPDPKSLTNLSVSPQKLIATASLPYSPLEFSDVSSFEGGSGGWYRIDTWLGEKWILKPALLEDIKEKPVSYNLKLTGQEHVYSYPFAVKRSEETINPQVVQVIAEWDNRTGPTQGDVWLKIELPQGKRWVVPQNPTLRDYLEVKESITLQTNSRYFDQPNLYMDEKGSLEPGTYDAFEVSGDWVHIHTAQGKVWVNPKRALLERPVCIVKTDEKIALTKDTKTFKYPLTSEPAHLSGYYAPQTVQAFEKWTSETGDVWYHFHGTGLDEWVTGM